MKLLNCLECHDIIKLRLNEFVECECRKSRGKYVDQIWAEHSGPSRVIGILNYEYVESLTATQIPYVTNYRWFPINDKDHVTKIGD